MASRALLAAITLASVTAGAWAQPVRINPHAAALFERDGVLREWALRFHDRNHDGWLTLYEAQEAAMAFKAIADTDRDGRVSVHEFGDAREFVRVRW